MLVTQESVMLEVEKAEAQEQETQLVAHIGSKRLGNQLFIDRIKNWVYIALCLGFDVEKELMDKYGT